VGKLVQQQETEGRLLAAICAAPTALKKHGVGKGKRVTTYPSVKDKMEGDGYIYCEDRVVIDGKYGAA
jgi:protein DJ-1